MSASPPAQHTRLPFEDYLAAIRRESARFREALTDCDPAARVPACPDWDAADLVWHLAGVQWFWSDVVGHRPDSPGDALEARRPPRAEGYQALLEQFDACSAALTDALAAADPAEVAWTWSHEQTVGFSFRRQAHEALIHRLDAEQTAGDGHVTPLDPRLATDGVAEALDVMYGGEAPEWGRVELGDHLLRVDLTDTGTALWVRPGTFVGTDPDSGKNYDGPHLVLLDDPGTDASTDAAATVTGTAAAVDAWLWKRRDGDVVELVGDPAALEAFRAAVSFPLT